jgi:cell wall assembly regulator SMI1
MTLPHRQEMEQLIVERAMKIHRGEKELEKFLYEILALKPLSDVKELFTRLVLNART